MRVYLDHNATSPLRPEARAAMAAAAGVGGNPSSSHREGAAARRVVEDARGEVAALLGATAAEIVFTSGASEANDLALAGVRARRIVTTAMEHASVLESGRALAANGCGLEILPVSAEGLLVPDDVTGAEVGVGTVVSVGLANGEVGSVLPVADIALRGRERGALVHTDAAQAVGRVPLDVRALGVDLVSLSAHKMGGPAGVGALWVRRGVEVLPRIHGGGQERGRRAGTENVIGIAGFAAAARAARLELPGVATRLATLRDRLWSGIRAIAGDAVRNGPSGEHRLPNTLNVTIPGVAGESALVLLDLEGVAISIGSACAVGAAAPSHVLVAMGRDPVSARAGLRFSFGWSSTSADVDGVLAVLPGVVARIRRGRAA